MDLKIQSDGKEKDEPQDGAARKGPKSIKKEEKFILKTPKVRTYFITKHIRLVFGMVFNCFGMIIRFIHNFCLFLPFQMTWKVK